MFFPIQVTRLSNKHDDDDDDDDDDETASPFY